MWIDGERAEIFLRERGAQQKVTQLAFRGHSMVMRLEKVRSCLAYLLCATAVSAATGCGGSSVGSRATGDGDGVDDGVSPDDPLEGLAQGSDQQSSSQGTDAVDEPSLGEPEATDGSPAEEMEGPQEDPTDVVPELVADSKGIPLLLGGDPAFHRFVRLTHQQWANSVRDNLKQAVLPQPEDLRRDTPSRTYYSNDEAILFVDDELYFDYEAAAEAVGEELASNPDALLQVHDATDPETFIVEVGQRFYRRPLTDEEVARYLDIYTTGATFGQGDAAFAKGASLVVEVLMQAPAFLYRMESAAVGEPVDGYEMATKLSYFLANTTPKADLLERVAEGALDSAEGVQTEARAMLAEATAAFRQFHSETWQVAALESLDLSAVDGYVPEMNSELQTAAELFFDDVFADDLGLDAILTSTNGYTTQRLSSLYGIDPAAVPEGSFAQVDLGPSRVGYFSQLPALMARSYQGQPNAVHRGVSLNERVLCVNLPPPSSIDVATLPRAEGQTNRDWLTEATSAPDCAQCHHTYINPLGLAFENFDGLGRARSEDEGQPVDTSGSYPLEEGELVFDGAPALMNQLAESTQAHECYAAHLLQYGLARQLVEADRSVVESVGASSREGKAVKELALMVASSDAFRLRAGD